MTVLAWRFVPADLRLPHGDGREIKVGEWLTVEPPIVACKHGLHASERAIDALVYADGTRSRLARVECDGEIAQDSDKFACSRMRHFWIASEADTQRELRLFAVWCARQALALTKNPDPRSIAACDVAERHAHGGATDAELFAVWDAARGAARDAAWDAAWGAAWDAEEKWQLDRLVHWLTEVKPLPVELPAIRAERERAGGAS